MYSGSLFEMSTPNGSPEADQARGGPPAPGQVPLQLPAGYYSAQAAAQPVANVSGGTYFVGGAAPFMQPQASGTQSSAPIAVAPLSHAGPLQSSNSPENSRGSAAARRQSDKSLFVSGLHPACEFTHLHERFQQYGKLISCRVLRDAKTGNSRCIGYVNFANGGDAGVALAEENGRPGPQGGGPMAIRYAEDDPAFVPEESRKLFVRYVPVNATTEHVRQAYGAFGTVTECTVMPDISSAARAEGEPWNMAYVTFTTAEEATLACAKTHRSFLFGNRHELAVKPAESLATRAQRQRKHDGSASSRGGSLAGSASNSAHVSATAAFHGGSGSHHLGVHHGSNNGSATSALGMGGMAQMPYQHHQMQQPMQHQQQHQQQQQQQQVVVPPGYQLAYLPGANGAFTPVLIPMTQQQQPQPQQQTSIAGGYGGQPLQHQQMHFAQAPGSPPQHQPLFAMQQPPQ